MSAAINFKPAPLKNAVAVDLLKPFTIPLDGLYALAPLRARLAARGRPEGALSLSESPAPASVLPETASAAAGATAP